MMWRKKYNIPYLFLDIDGVLNHNGSEWICKENLTNLIDIIQKTNPRIILTSSWRIEVETARMQYFFSLFESYDTVIYDATKDLGSRRKEIEQYVKRNRVKLYAILDDEDYYTGTKLVKHVFMTSFDEGLTKEIAERVTDYLSKEPVK